MEKQNITIYEIAKEAGVSPSTVSRVLTGSARVRQDKKEAVEALIEKYNFKPNAIARSLSTPRQQVIGLIAADVRNEFYANLYVACEMAAARRGYMLMLYNSLGQLDYEKNILGMLLEQRVAGVIHLGGAADDMETDAEYVKLLNERPDGIPYVTTGKFDGVKECYRVQVDAKAAVDLLAEHLKENGYRRIALLGGRYDVLSTHTKYDQFVKRAQEIGFATGKEYLDNWGDYSPQLGEETMDALFERLEKAKKPLPEAIIAINDGTAVGVLRSIRHHGYRVPEDIAVVGYDNVCVSEFVEPKLTTIDYDYDAFGRKLVDTVIRAVEGKKKIPSLQLLKPDIIVRESSRPRG
ncbi:MAG: LacI family transcriptional regulator [Lachnospiraceae bacterium]|nr:LacI family transcriptional regulator [Lachnospiraceae bacterium]